MRATGFLPLFCLIPLLCSCTFEHAQETILATHANGAKKTSVWVYPDGEILKRNEWYSDGIKELEIPYKDNVPHGEFKRWDGLGDLVLVGEYKKGKRGGKWISYYGGNFNKKTEAIRYYKDDHAVDDWEGWHFNGNKAFEEHYSDSGDSIGTWKKWSDNGNIAEENSCFSTQDSGIYRKYSYMGILEEEHQCQNGNRNGEATEYYSDGKKVKLSETWRDNQLDGPRTLYYANGKIQKREFWKEGERDSIWQWFSPEGNLVAQSQLYPGELSGNKRVDYGVCTKTLPDSTMDYVICADSTFMSIGEFNHRYALHGEIWYFKDGHDLLYKEEWASGHLYRSESYYPDTISTPSKDSVCFNRRASEGYWAMDSLDNMLDKRNGIWRNWYGNGVLRDSLTYINGERIGEQFSYDSTGKLTIHKTENGKMRPVIMHLK